MKRSSVILAVVASATTLAMPAASAAPLAEGLVTPLQIDVSGDSVYVSQAFAGLVTRIDADGSRHDLVQEEGAIGGVAAADDGSVAYTFSGGDANGRGTSRYVQKSVTERRGAAIRS